MQYNLLAFWNEGLNDSFCIQRIDYYSKVVVIHLIYSEGSPVFSRKKLSRLTLNFISSDIILIALMTWVNYQDLNGEMSSDFKHLSLPESSVT